MKTLKIYDYTDYRRFLKESLDAYKQENTNVSYRGFNRKLGFKSSGALKLIIDGKRSLASDGIYKITKGLKLTEAEARYLNSMVQMNNAGNHEQKDFHFREMLSIRPKSRPKTIEQSLYKVFGKWYYVALLEVVRLADFQNDPKWIAKKMVPQVNPREVKKAIADLIEIGLLKKDELGRLVRIDNVLATPDEVRSVSVLNFHNEMIDVARKALNETAANERDFSTLTISIAEEDFAKLKSMVQEFRKKVHAELETDDKRRNTVAHINFQLFKLTKGDVQ